VKEFLSLLIAILHAAWTFLRAAFVACFVIVLAFSTGFVVAELRSSELQARHIADYAKKLKFWLAAGPSEAIRFPASGPFDERMGYANLPVYLKKLGAAGFAVTQQARVSPETINAVDRGLYLPFHEKTQAGLKVYDCRKQAIFSAGYPERLYSNFQAIPPSLVQTLLFIENRELLDTRYPMRNPAVEWDRFAKALLDQGISLLFRDHDTPGGSTLATQIEKYRHSPDGRTLSGRDKLRQMASASVRAYLDGEDTTAARERVVLDYLNTVPLAARVGYGEVNGLGDGLWAWFGRDFQQVNQLLRASASDPTRQAEAYKQVLALMIAQRRPSGLLGQSETLNGLANNHIRWLADAGVISPALREAASAVELKFRAEPVAQPPTSFATRKVAATVRANLAGLLGAPRLYDLDRLDLTVSSTLNAQLQKSITETLHQLKTREGAASAGLTPMLEGADPSKVIYSFTLFERAAGANFLRVQTDNYDQPFDINEGTKLDLGSTAKFRTLVTYLEIIADIHQRFHEKPVEELTALLPDVDAPDVLTRWALEYLLAAQTRELGPMLEAAMERQYSANADEQFYTGGGLHTFANFNASDNERVMSVREGFRGSVNLVFVRIMRDVVRHYMFSVPGSSARLLSDEQDPRRKEYLARFADREGRVYVRRFYAKYRGKTQPEAQALLMQSVRPTAPKLAAIFRYLDPEGGEGTFRAFLGEYMKEGEVTEAEARKLYARYAADKFSLADRAFVVGVHPLELWVVAFLRANPGATEAQAYEGSADERQAVYRWLFTTRSKNAQDQRILNLLETEGFLEVHRHWQRLGYPFDSMVPSYASALGSSADRPAALAELMGIIVNDGVRQASVRLTDLHFAQGTPYETKLENRSTAAERVLSSELVQVARRSLIDVVESGTARRVGGSLFAPDGSPIVIGGKTGTGDHRHDVYGPGGRLISSRVVNRSATFMFFLGDRYFGTVVAYVPGAEAAKYKFTSAIAAQLLKSLTPSLAKLFDPRAAGEAQCVAGKG
jgi:membrane peptidoglycan carboxypeptidase